MEQVHEHANASLDDLNRGTGGLLDRSIPQLVKGAASRGALKLFRPQAGDLRRCHRVEPGVRCLRVSELRVYFEATLASVWFRVQLCNRGLCFPWSRARP